EEFVTLTLLAGAGGEVFAIDSVSCDLDSGVWRPLQQHIPLALAAYRVRMAKMEEFVFDSARERGRPAGINPPQGIRVILRITPEDLRFDVVPIEDEPGARRVLPDVTRIGDHVHALNLDHVEGLTL